MKNDIPHLHSSPKFLLTQSSSPKFQINVQRILTCLIHIHAWFLESLSNGFPLSSTLQAAQKQIGVKRRQCLSILNGPLLCMEYSKVVTSL